MNKVRLLACLLIPFLAHAETTDPDSLAALCRERGHIPGLYGSVTALGWIPQYVDLPDRTLRIECDPNVASYVCLRCNQAFTERARPETTVFWKVAQSEPLPMFFYEERSVGDSLQFRIGDPEDPTHFTVGDTFYYDGKLYVPRWRSFIVDTTRGQVEQSLKRIRFAGVFHFAGEVDLLVDRDAIGGDQLAWGAWRDTVRLSDFLDRYGTERQLRIIDVTTLKETVREDIYEE